MKTIIYAHPHSGSFNHAILTHLTTKLSVNHTPYQLIDLYADQFDPVLSAEDLHSYNDGIGGDPLVERYQQMLAATTDLILIFPVWWYDLPAILRGFFDKVLLPGITFTADVNGRLTGKLTHIKRATVITTAGQNLAYLQSQQLDAIQTVFINQVLPDMGVNSERVRRLHFGTVGQDTAASSDFIQTVLRAF